MREQFDTDTFEKARAVEKEPAQIRLKMPLPKYAKNEKYSGYYLPLVEL